MDKKIIIGAILVLIVIGFSLFVFMKSRKSTIGNTVENYVFSNDWLDKRNIYVYWNPPLDYLRAVNATGVTWSVYWGGLNEPDEEYVDSLHQNGFKVASNFPTVQGNITENQILRESAHCINFNGDPSKFIGDQYAMCHNNPVWQEFLKSRIREHIDGKADAIHIDEIGNIGIDSNGGFCEYCMAVFNSYLSSRYSSTQLRELFGINDIASFNYRTYLLSKGAQSIWEDPNPDLMNEYRKSQFLSKVALIRELVQYAREYAGRDLLISGNTYDIRSSQQIYLPYLDFAVFEMSIGDLPQGKLFTSYLLGEAMDPSKPLVGFPDIFDLANLSEDDWWLWRHWLAESYACGASFLLPYKAYTSGGGQYTIPAERVSPYTSFISDHSSYYENTSRLVRVAVLFDFNSTLFNQWHAQLSWESFENTGRAIQEAHIPFEIAYVGDGEFVNKPITLSSLEKYSVVVVPSYYQLAQETMDVLDQYFSGGGHVIWSNETLEVSNLVAEVRSTGVNFGLETNASSDLSIMVYKKGNSLLLHLINYNYDNSAHDFTPQTQIEITLTIPGNVDLAGKTLRLLSPDTGEETINYTIQGDSVMFTIPNVHEYSIASFE